MFRRVLVIIVAAAAGVVGLLAVLPVAAQQGGANATRSFDQANATRSFDQDTVTAGGQVVVTIMATDYGSLGAVTETLPAGFIYVSSSLTDEGEVTEVDDVTVRFTLQGADKTFTYTVTASKTAADYDFDGKLRDSDRMDTPVGGDTRVTVEAVAVEPSSAVATRSFDTASVAAGGEVVVTIEATGYGSLGAVTETLPAGFIYVSSSLTDEGEVTEVDDVTVRFTLQGADKTFTYTVTASKTAADYDFDGKLRDSDRMDTPVGGDTRVTVEAVAVEPSSAVATRSFDTASVAAGGEVVVTIEATGYGSLGAVTETLPAGFSYVSSSLTDEGEVTEVDDVTVRFTLQGADKTFTYTVTASNTGGTHDFSGKLRDADRADHDVGGDSRVTVLGPSATRSFSPTRVSPNGRVRVTITAADYGSLGAVTETLPAEFSYVSSSLTDEGEVTEVDDRTVRFTLQGADKTFTYTVNATSTVGTYDFSGVLRDSDRTDHDVGGADRVTVARPTVRPRPTATPTATPRPRGGTSTTRPDSTSTPTPRAATATPVPTSTPTPETATATPTPTPTPTADGHAYPYPYPDGAGCHSDACAETSVNRRHSATLAGPAGDPRFATGHRRSAAGWESAP